MKEKYQSKYLAKGGAPEKKKKPVGLIIVLVVLLAGAICAGGFFLGRSIPEIPEADTTKPTVSDVQKEPDVVEIPTSAVIEYANIETAYGMLQIDKAYADSIRHEEIILDGVTMEVFYMVLEEEEWELFRIHYGDAETGNLLGKVRTDVQEVSVSVTTNTNPAEGHLNAEAISEYYALMDQLNVVLDSIRAGSNFVPLGGQDAAVQPANLTYWDLELPESISWQEATSDDSYRVDFYGTVADTVVQLYTVSMGDEADGNILGMYDMNGETVPVCITTYTMRDQETVLPESYGSEYAALMDSIDAVIQAIMSDSHFSNGVG